MANSSLSKEEDYFLKKELELRRKTQEEAEKKLKAEEKKLKHLHHMRCPKCGMELTEIEFRNIRVDRCFSCEGTWFDAGEVEQALKLKKGAFGAVIDLFKK
jgi:hypothetical protein